MPMELEVLAWDRFQIVAGLNRVMDSYHPLIIESPKQDNTDINK